MKRSLSLEYPNGENIKFTSSKFSRPVGEYLLVNNDYNQVWKMPNKEGKQVTLKLLDRNSRNEILMGKKQGLGYNSPSGQSVPATARFLDDTFVSFTKELQYWFHFTINAGKTSASQAKKDFANCFRDNAWMTNNAGSWTRADYINNNNKPPYIQLQPMVTGGSVLKFVEEIVYKRQPAVLFEAINPLANYTDYSPLTHRWLFFRPTNSARVEILNPKGSRIGFKTWYQEPSNSWYGEKMEMAVWGFIKNNKSSTGWCGILEKSRVSFLKNDQPIPNPYIMRDGRVLQNPYEGF